MKTLKTIIGAVLILIAICCLIVMSAREVPKEEVTTTTTTTTTETTTESTTESTTTTTTTTTEPYVPSPRVFDDEEYIAPEYFKRMGVISDGKYNYTWYSENVLPGGALKIPGRHSDGNYVRDEEDYIVIASSDLSKGTMLETPFGLAKVYDDGCASGIVDVYVSW